MTKQILFVSGCALLTALTAACNKGSKSSFSPPPPVADTPHPPSLGIPIEAEAQAGLVRTVPLDSSISVGRVGRGPDGAVWITDANQVALVDLKTGKVLRSVQLPFSVEEDRNLLGTDRNVALLRTNGATSGTDVATIDTTNLGLHTYRLAGAPDSASSLAMTRDFAVMAVNTDSSVRFYTHGLQNASFDVLKAELAYPQGFTSFTNPDSPGTLISRDSHYAITPVRKTDGKEAGLFLMDLRSRETSLVAKQSAARPGQLVGAPNLYAFSQDSAYLLLSSDARDGHLSVLNLVSGKIEKELQITAGQNLAIDSMSDPQMVGGKIFVNVTLFDPDASERTSQINIYDFASGKLVSELKVPEAVMAYTVTADHELVAAAASHLYLFSF